MHVGSSVTLRGKIKPAAVFSHVPVRYTVRGAGETRQHILEFPARSRQRGRAWIARR
jgi:hypothetical protein